jgi:ABC-2 type transport system permease protein
VTTQSMPDTAVQAAMPTTRPFYWSVRRELWEHRSIYLAPLAVAAFMLLGFSFSALKLPGKLVAATSLTPGFQTAALAMTYSFGALMLMVTALFVSMFYCLGALYGERRDRSILFWKSLPVSDLTTVLAKVTIPFVVVPVTVFVISIALHIILLLVSTAVLMGSGISPSVLWTELPLLRQPLLLLYGLIVAALWHAPIYGWLLLLSGWAQRGPFLWAVLPVVGLCAFEKIAFDSTHVFQLVQHRLNGAFTEAFVMHASANGPSLTEIDPVRFFTTPGLWIGLVVAAGLIAASVWMRRFREPI